MYPVRTEFNISSPNYPKEYPPYQFCEWKIEADAGQNIELVINDIQLEKGYDYLIACDGKECFHDNIINTYTGNSVVCVCVCTLIPHFNAITRSHNENRS